MEKSDYRGIVTGTPPSGVIDAPIMEHPVHSGNNGGAPQWSHWALPIIHWWNHLKFFTLVEFRIFTGRNTPNTGTVKISVTLWPAMNCTGDGNRYRFSAIKRMVKQE